MAKRWNPVIRQRIIEVRFEQGYRYLDRCGDALVILEDLLGDDTQRIWLTDEATPAGARLSCPDLNMRIVFSSHRMVVDQFSPSEFECEFNQIAATTLATITGRFDLRKMKRYGNRVIKIVPADSIEDAEKMSVQISQSTKSWPLEEPGFHPRSVERTFVFDLEDRSKGIRVVTGPFSKIGADIQPDERLKQPPHLLPAEQRTALLDQLKREQQKRRDPETGLAIDLDYFWAWPSENVSLNEFLEEAQRELDCFEQAVLKR